MTEIMNWEVCERDFVKRIEPDLEKVDSIKRMCKTRQRLIMKRHL